MTAQALSYRRGFETESIEAMRDDTFFRRCVIRRRNVGMRVVVVGDAVGCGCPRVLRSIAYDSRSVHNGDRGSRAREQLAAHNIAAATIVRRVSCKIELPRLPRLPGDGRGASRGVYDGLFMVGAGQPKYR